VSAPGPVSDWHPWFAWRPVYTPNAGWVWLRMVERQRWAQHHDRAGWISWWMYRREPETRAVQ
jgi:hypothetical protein